MWVRRRPSLAGLGVALVLAMLAGTITSTVLAIRATKAESDALRAGRLAQSRFEAEQDARLHAERAEAEAERESERARTEADTARAINDFLNRDLLGQADPTVIPDRDTTLRAVLDRAADKVWTRLEGQPLVAAALHHTLGTTYKVLGEYDEAERHALRALEIHERETGKDSRKTIEDRALLIDILFFQARQAESEALCRETIEVARRALGREDPLTISVRTSLAVSLLAQGRLEESERHFLEILETDTQTGRGDDRTSSTMQNLANALSRMGRHAEAEALGRRALAVRRAQPVLNELGLAHNLFWHAKTLARMSRHAEALRLDREAYAIRERIYGPEHPFSQHILKEIDGLKLIACRSVGDHAEFLRSYEELARSGSDDPFFLRRRGEMMAGLGQWRNALRDWSAVPELGAGNVDVLNGLKHSALVLSAGTLDDYRSYVRQLDRRFRATHPTEILLMWARDPDPPLTGEQFMELAVAGQEPDATPVARGMSSMAYYFAGDYETARDLMNLPGWYGGDVAYWLARIHHKLGDGTAPLRLRRAEDDYHRLSLHCLSEPTGIASWMGEWSWVVWTQAFRKGVWREIVGTETPPDDPVQQAIDTLLMRSDEIDHYFERLIGSQTSDPIRPYQRWVAAHVGWRRWDEARAVLDRFIGQCPEYHPVWLRRAALDLMAGDEEGYAAFCRSLLADLAQTQDAERVRMLVRCFALAPHAVDGGGRLLDLARRAGGGLPGDEAPDSIALTLYLEGDDQGAIARMGRVAAGRPGGATLRDWLLLALSQGRSGDEDKARESLAGFKAKLAEKSQHVAFDWAGDWAEDFELDRMRVAAEKTLGDLTADQAAAN